MSREYEGRYWTIDRFISGFSNNAYLITCRRTNQSVIIDTPDRPDELIRAAGETQVNTILITHSHWDHIQGFQSVHSAFTVPTGIGEADASELTRNGSPGLVDVSDGTIIRAGDISLRASETPGHTPGSTCYLLPGAEPSDSPAHVFTGDTLFPGGPGKTTSPSAFRRILESITTRLLTLPGDTVVLPGHGDFTNIAEAEREYAVFEAREKPADLYGEVTWAKK
ncbi:MAG: MBL fold metallo-hydrolase [Dehalococcoidia bacterium]